MAIPSKTILVLGAGFFARPLLKQLRAEGFRVIACDGNSQAAGRTEADEFYPVDISNSKAVLRLAYSLPIDGIMPINEYGVCTAAFVSEQLNLPGNSLQSAKNSTNKHRMRLVWERAGLDQPKFACFSNSQELDIALDRIGYPCVLKPLNIGGGSRGISAVMAPEEITWAWDRARPFASQGQFLLESFLVGTEMTIEAFVRDGDVTILAMSDKVKPPLRTQSATSITYPADFPDEILTKVRDLSVKAIQALGITVGMTHTELIVSPEGQPRLVETASRPGGGPIFYLIIQDVSGVNAPVVTAKTLVGDSVGLPTIKRRAACWRFFFPPKGIYRAIEGVEEVSGLPGVREISFTCTPGDVIGVWDDDYSRPGHVVTSAETRLEAIALADKVESSIKFVVDDDEQKRAP